MSAVPLVRVIRSGLEESVHEGDIAVVDQEGRLVAHAGDAHRVIFARSCMKPLQAAVSLSLARVDPTDAELAVMCASHNAETVHVQTVRALLSRAGIPESALLCPPARPWDLDTALASPEPLRINSDCSGKHAGMLAACRAQGWAEDAYRDADHPLQEAVLEAVRSATDLDSVRVGVDGCGVAVHGLPLASMATVYARLARPHGLGALASFTARAVEAMRAEPYMVAGRNRVDTAVMEAEGTVVVKSGAEGLICAALTERGLGVAIRIRDGSSRASGPALIRTLRQVEVLDEAQEESLDRYGRPRVLGGGNPVGEMVADFQLVSG